MRSRGPIEKELMERCPRMIPANPARVFHASRGTPSPCSGVSAERRRLYDRRSNALWRGALLRRSAERRYGGMKLSLAWLVVILLNGAVVRAQPYSVDWFKVSSGGGTSLGGAYSLSGTIGQHDAGGPMTGGNYSLTSGFWSLLSIVPAPGSPTLTIAFTSTNSVIISWPSPSAGFTIQQSTTLAGSSWTAPPEGISDDGINKSIVLQSLAGTRFFRLTR